MSYVPCRERTFAVRLAGQFEHQYRYYLHWLKHLLERLGREPTLDVGPSFALPLFLYVRTSRLEARGSGFDG